MKDAVIRRKPAVAGQFYEGSKARLEAQVAQYIVGGAVPEKVIGMVSPHAGLMYSGAVAGELYSRIEVPRTFVLIGPNHTGLGAPLAVMSFGQWDIPSGSVEVDFRLAELLLEYVDPLQEDEQAHLLEHSLEVQLPFIVHVAPAARIVPIVMGDTSLESCRALGQGIGEAVRELDYSVVIVASSDMSHFISDGEARRVDRLAIDQIVSLAPEALHEVVRRHRITMCGCGPATALLYAAQVLGAKSAELVAYQTSGDVSGDRARVVGYAGILIR